LGEFFEFHFAQSGWHNLCRCWVLYHVQESIDVIFMYKNKLFSCVRIALFSKYTSKCSISFLMYIESAFKTKVET
jgi:hypothetical protein